MNTFHSPNDPGSPRPTTFKVAVGWIELLLCGALLLWATYLVGKALVFPERFMVGLNYSLAKIATPLALPLGVAGYALRRGYVVPQLLILLALVAFVIWGWGGPQPLP